MITVKFFKKIPHLQSFLKIIILTQNEFNRSDICARHKLMQIAAEADYL